MLVAEDPDKDAVLVGSALRFVYAFLQAASVRRLRVLTVQKGVKV